MRTVAANLTATTTTSTRRPVLAFFDLDGVFNARPAPGHEHSRLSEHTIPGSSAEAGGDSGWLDFDAIRAVNTLITDTLIEPVWITSRGAAANNAFSRAVGLAGGEWATADITDDPNTTSWGKTTVLEQILARRAADAGVSVHDIPFVFAHNTLNSGDGWVSWQRHNVEHLAGGPRLLVDTDPARGITSQQVSTVRSWAEKHSVAHNAAALLEPAPTDLDALFRRIISGF